MQPEGRVLVVAPPGSKARTFDLGPHYHVDGAAHVAEAIGRLGQEEFSGVLIEMTRPDEDTWTAFDRLQVAKPDVPILVVSMEDEEDVARRVLREGAQDYLVLGALEPNELVRRIRAAELRHRVGRERQASLERLRELERFKTQFINTAAHELNSPLTPIKLQLHLLKVQGQADLTPRQAASLDIVDRNVDRLIALVADVLDAARLQADRLTVRKQPIDLSRLVTDAIASFEEAAKRAKVQLEAHADEAVTIDADPDRINQVLFNLVMNALKFTPAGGNVRVELDRKEGHAVVRVQDSGIGLRREDFPRLFQPFSQTHEWTSSKKTGSGLGLYISQGIVEQHGGRIWVDSPGPHRGATFSFAIPLPAAPSSAPAPASHPTRRIRKASFWPILYFKCPTCGSRDIDMRILRNKYQCRACTDEWR